MFSVTLKFTGNKSNAGQFMDGHNQWLKRGFDDGVFLLAGGLQPGLGGTVMAQYFTNGSKESSKRGSLCS